MPKDFLYFTVSFTMLTGQIVFFRDSEVLFKQKEKIFSLARLFFILFCFLSNYSALSRTISVTVELFRHFFSKLIKSID